MLDVSRHGRGVLIRVLAWAVDERIGRGEGRGRVTAKRGVGSSSSHCGTLMMGVEGRMRGGSVGEVVVRRRELGRTVGPIRAMMEIHSGRE